jgi:oligopeptide/dipeptide ABC transporter ATP-binding protein
MIFQEPMTSLNPVYTVGTQVMEPLMLHEKMSSKQARARAIELFQEVGIPEPERRLDAYPHELSGGLRQRVVIAMAISCRPKILIADEPTTALDVTIQAQILKLLKSLQEKYQMGLLLITHDLGVVAEVAHRVSVMYTGKIVETATVSDFFKSPLHPYSRGLLASIPRPGKELKPIKGMVPSLRQLPPGCTFHPRCTERFEPCDKLVPELLPLPPNESSNAPTLHRTRCHAVHPPRGEK